MRTNKSAVQSNKILLRNLLHLSKLVFFASLPISLHVHHMEYMRDFFSNPPGPGDPLPVPSPYPFTLVLMAITAIVLDLMVLWKRSKRNYGYENHAVGIIVFELVLICIIPDSYLVAYRILMTTPATEKVVMLLGISLLGFLEMLFRGQRNIKRISTVSSIQ